MSDLALPTEPAPMNELARFSGVFFEPKKTFTDIAERPRWIVPVLVTIVMSVVFLMVFTSRIGWESYMHRVMDNNPRMAQLTPEQRDNVFNTQVKLAPVFGFASVVVFIPLSLIVSAGVIVGIVKSLLGAPITFKQVFAIMSYAFLPRVLLSVLAIVVMYVTKNPEDFDLQNPFFSNPAALMDPLTSSKFLYSLAGSLDVFSIWVILLVAIGLKAAGGKRLSFGGALFSVVLPWAVITLIRAAAAAAGLTG